MNTLYLFMILASVLLVFFLLLLGVLRISKGHLKLFFILSLLSFSGVNIGWLLKNYLGAQDWSSVTLLSVIWMYPLSTVYALSFFHGHGFTRSPVFLALLLPAVAFSIAVPFLDPQNSIAYNVPFFGYYMVSCLGIAIAESLFFWLKSSIFKKESYLLMLGYAVLLCTGPIYFQELQILNLRELIGSDLGVPFMALAIYYVSSRNSYPTLRALGRISRTKKRSRYAVGHNPLLAIDETRPKFSRTIFADLSQLGRPSLILTEEEPGKIMSEYEAHQALGVRLYSKAGRQTIQPTRLGATWHLAKSFLGGYENGVLLLDGFHYILSNNSLKAVKELLANLVKVAKTKKATIILPLCLLTPNEKALLLPKGFPPHRLPDVERIVEDILENHVGSFSHTLLSLYCRRRGKRVVDLRLEDIPDFSLWASEIVHSLGLALQEKGARKGLAEQARELANDLIDFYRLDVLSEEKILISPERNTSLFPLVVSTESKRVVESSNSSVSPEKRLEEFLLWAFGEVGRYVLERQKRRLGKTAGELSVQDVEMLAENAGAELLELAEVIDIDGAKTDMKSRVLWAREALKGVIEKGGI